MKYDATERSLQKHVLPKWYDGAKFGIFIHWSLFSVPGYAGEQYQDISETFRKDPEGVLLNYPYAEWYYNSLRIPGSQTERFHKKHYGNRDYFSFQKDFEEENMEFSVNSWVDLIRKAGARYVIFVTKHHDGYNLWPTKFPNPKIPEYYSKRDFTGELTECVRNAGLKMGLYYSGAFDWSFKNQFPITDAKSYLYHLDMSEEYVSYAVCQIKELIDRYHPSVLWNDIAFPQGYDLKKLFAYYYNVVEDGVINDRWKQMKIPRTE